MPSITEFNEIDKVMMESLQVKEEMPQAEPRTVQSRRLRGGTILAFSLVLALLGFWPGA